MQSFQKTFVAPPTSQDAHKGHGTQGWHRQGWHGSIAQRCTGCSNPFSKSCSDGPVVSIDSFLPRVGLRVNDDMEALTKKPVCSHCLCRWGAQAVSRLSYQSLMFDNPSHVCCVLVASLFLNEACYIIGFVLHVLWIMLNSFSSRIFWSFHRQSHQGEMATPIGLRTETQNLAKTGLSP